MAAKFPSFAASFLRSILRRSSYGPFGGWWTTVPAETESGEMVCPWEKRGVSSRGRIDVEGFSRKGGRGVPRSDTSSVGIQKISS